MHKDHQPKTSFIFVKYKYFKSILFSMYAILLTKYQLCNKCFCFFQIWILIFQQYLHCLSLLKLFSFLNVQFLQKSGTSKILTINHKRQNFYLLWAYNSIVAKNILFFISEIIESLKFLVEQKTLQFALYVHWLYCRFIY